MHKDFVQIFWCREKFDIRVIRYHSDIILWCALLGRCWLWAEGPTEAPDIPNFPLGGFFAQLDFNRQCLGYIE